MKHSLLGYVVLGCALAYAGNAMAQHESMNCALEPITHMTLAEGDQSTATHLQLSRVVSNGARVTLNVCAGDITVKAGKGGDLKVVADFDTAPAKPKASDYVQAFDVAPDVVNVKLHLPKHPRAKVLIELPAQSPKLEINLVEGNLVFETDRIVGDRTINVVSGNAELLANEDSYHSFQADVLLGSFEDHRKGGEKSHGIISKSLSGTGRGSLAVNVVRGNVEVKSWD